MKNQEQLLKIVARIRETLTTEYGEKFTTLTQDEKNSIMICVLHDLATRNSAVMRVAANAFVEML